MSDIFISYARADRPKAEVLTHALEAHGWSVWWDREVPVGKSFDKVIEEALQAARCVLVLWSKESVASRWVLAEAEEGVARGILVPILIEEVRLPLAFRRIQAADLTGWEGATTAASFQRLVADIAGILGAPAKQAEEDRRFPESRVNHQLGDQRRRRSLWAATAVVLLIGAVLWDGLTCGGLWDAARCDEPQPPPTGTLVLTALPWAEVKEIATDTGKPFAIPEDAYTPLRLSLPAGTYTITLANPSVTKKITVEVTAGETVERIATLTEPDVDTYFREAGWQTSQ